MSNQEEIRILLRLIKENGCSYIYELDCESCPLDVGRGKEDYSCLSEPIREARKKLMTYNQEELFETLL